MDHERHSMIGSVQHCDDAINCPLDRDQDADVEASTFAKTPMAGHLCGSFADWPALRSSFSTIEDAAAASSAASAAALAYRAVEAAATAAACADALSAATRRSAAECAARSAAAAADCASACCHSCSHPHKSDAPADFYPTCCGPQVCHI